MQISIIGAGNGGQAFAGALGLQGCSITLYDKYAPLLDAIRERGGIEVTGCVQGFAKIQKFAYALSDAVKDANLVLVVTTADAHRDVARELASCLTDDQIVVLCPGRTGGALEFRKTFIENGGSPNLLLGEAQTLVYACRSVAPGLVNIIGIKDRVLASALPSVNTSRIVDALNSLFHCFIPTPNVLTTSLENIGAMFHPGVVLFNAATIERGQPFYFYRDMSSHIASFIEKIDAIRLEIGRAYGIELIGVSDWIDYAYPGTQGTTLCEKMKNNPAYYEILAPSKLVCRQLTEDVPTGLLPMAELGRAANVDVSLYDSLITLVSNLLDIDFRKTGRTLERLGLSGLNSKEILRAIQ